MDKVLLAKMNEFRKYNLMRADIRKELLSHLKEKFPSVQDAFFGDNYISIETEKHTMRLNEYSDLKTTAPEFVCTSKTKMVDTVEEFLAMKKFVENDYLQCYTACNYLFFRYDFGLMDNYRAYNS